jgi:spore germination protein
LLIHVVRSGESLRQIAERYGVALSRLLEVNEWSAGDPIIPGLALLIPTASRYHTVRPGETIWRIAARYGVSAEAVIRANPSVDPANLRPGMTLVIPPVLHTVRAGETIAGLAGRYRTTVQAILSANAITDPNRLVPGTVLAIPAGEKPSIETNGFTYLSGSEGAAAIDQVGDLLTFMAPFAYRIQANGGLEPFPDEALIPRATAKRVTPMMAITNFTSSDPGSALAHAVLANESVQETLLDRILATMRAKGYRGLNVDFENVYPQDRNAYNRFLERARDRLHAAGYFLSTSLAPKTSGAQQGLLYEAHDYAAHGRIADFVVLMTYEWGYRLGPPRAISPLGNIKQVLDYAVTVIPRHKIMMGFQIYARDWLLPHVPGREAETFSPREAIRRAVRYGAVIQYDEASASPYFRYYDERGRLHEVWFEDARSALAKFELLKSYPLRGVSYWVLGYEYPENWALLGDLFTIIKRP